MSPRPRAWAWTPLVWALVLLAPAPGHAQDAPPAPAAPSAVPAAPSASAEGASNGSVGRQPGGVSIDKVEIRGNRRSEAEAILQLIASQAGSILDRNRIQADIRAIFQLGFYTDVQADLSEVDGKSVLTYIVTEKPSIRTIKYEGNDKLDEDDLKAVVDLREFGILDLAKVTRNTEKLRDLYTEKGYFLAEVNYDVVTLADNEVDVIFKIVEKQEVKVARITIVGNHALSDQEIKDNLETQEGGFLELLTSAGSFKAEAFERDTIRISQFYYDKGYITARVGKPKIELSPDKTEMYLTVPVEEGDRYHTGEIDIQGDMLRPKAELMKLVALKKGEWFSSGQLRETINAIGELYKDEGYAYVNPTPNTDVDPDKKLVSLIVDIDKGKKVRFGRISVVGNSRTRDKVVRRELRIYEGEYYSSSGIKRSKMLIQRLGFFETVEINTSRGATDDTMDVVVEVKEKATGTFQVGAGFSSLESFIAQAQISQNNLFGRGQTLALQATLSKLRTIANIQFADDYFLDTKIRFATDVYRIDNNFQDFTRKSLGADLTFGYPLNDDWSVAGTYTLEQVDVTSGGYGSRSVPTIVNLYGSGLTSSMKGSLIYDTRNNRLFPTEGFFGLASVEEANKVFLSENEFTRYTARLRYYIDLTLDMVLKLNIEGGLIVSPNRSGVPIYERYFVGGPLSVRGFRRLSLGPQVTVFDNQRPDSGTVLYNLGGNEQLMLNAEYEFPIFQKVGIRGVFFTDGGNAFNRSDAISEKLNSLRFAWGFGVRWFSPIGPLRFEWGFPFSPRSNEESSVFEFSIGNFF